VRLVDEAGQVFEMGADVGEGGHVDAPLGEIEVQTTGLMDGYWGAPEATDSAIRDGWFRTGDTGTFEAGHLRIVGRTSTDILKSAGYKIGAGEIEDVLSAAGLLREAAVVGLADPKWGEIVTAVIVPREGLDEATLIARLEAHCAGLLVDYKRPRRYVVVESLPRNALGKVQKASLKQTLFG
jgi:acyl-CoA synthetase (AMP-forming)/AMP-acid ligase II